MKQILFLLLIALCSCHSTTSKKGQDNEADSILLQEELHPDSILNLNLFQRKKNKGNHREQQLLFCNLFHVILQREKLSAPFYFPCRQNTIIIHYQQQK